MSIRVLGVAIVLGVTTLLSACTGQVAAPPMPAVMPSPAVPAPVQPVVTATPAPTATPTPRPISGVNLLPVAPQGWESPLIVSSIPGARQSGPVAVDGPVYISFSVGNRGSNATPSNFFSDLLVDGVVVHRVRYSPLDPRFSATVTDWADLQAMVRLTPGKHRVRLVVDPTNLVAETDKADNVLEREVEWAPPAAPLSVTPPVIRKPNLAPFQLKGWDGVIVAASAQESISSASARSGPLSVDATTYISYGLKNVGLTSIGVPFWVYTYLDGVLVDRAKWDNGLPSDTTTWRRPISALGQTVPLVPGPHTLRVVVDATNLIDESNEDDNVFEQPFLWGVGPVPPTPTRVPPTPTPTAKEQAPFTFQYPLNDSNIGFFTQNDTIETLLAASPFYTGDQPLPSQGTSQYDNARAKKVDEIKREAGSLARAAVKLKPRLDDVRSAYLSYLTTVLQEEPKLNDFAQKTFGQVGALASKEAVTEGEYNSIQTVGVTNAYAKAFMDYLKVVKAVELGGLYLQDANNLMAYAALALEGLGSSQNATIKKANAQLDKDMQALDNMRPDLLAVVSSMQKIDYGLRQLATGNYYFSLAANDFIAASLPDLKAKVASLTPREGLTADDIQAIKAYLALFEKWQSQVKQATDSLDPSRRIKVSLRREAEDYLYLSYTAEPEGNYASAVASLSAPLQADEAKEKESGYFSNGWSAVKSAVHHDQVQRGAGLVIDTLKVAVDAAVNVAGLGWANTPADIWQDVKKDATTVIDNLNRGVSGVETLKTAERYLEETEEKVGGAAGAGAAKLVGGEGLTSWAVGGVAETTVGVFTGLGKGIYKLANMESTPGQRAEGVLEVAFSIMGGSKVVIKGSGLSEGASLAGKSALAYLRSALNTAEKTALAKERKELLLKLRMGELTAQELDKLVSNYMQLEAKKALEKELQQSLKLTTAEMARLAKEGIAAKWQRTDGEIAKEVRQMMKDQYKRSLDGYVDAMRAVIGVDSWTWKSLKDYLINLVGSWADDWIKKWVREHLDGEKIDKLVEASRDARGTTTTVAPPTSTRADLTVLPVTLSPSSAKPGDRISVSFTVKNQGGTASGPFSNRISLATSRWGTDTSLGNFSMGGLAAGASQSSTVSVTIPPAVSPGSYWVTVFTDSLQAVSEGDENNNIGSSDPNKINILSSETRGSFSGSFGTISARSGCRWELPFTADLVFTLTYNPDGSATGSGTVDVKIITPAPYVPPNVDAWANGCVHSVLSRKASGTVTVTRDGAVKATLTGAQSSTLSFTGTRSGDTITGSASLGSNFTTTGTSGGTSLTTSVSNIRLR